MAAVAKSTEGATELISKLTLDTKDKTNDVPETAKKSTVKQPSEQSSTAQPQKFVDSNSVIYMPNGYTSTPYYYGGYNGSLADWKDYPRYVSPDGVGMLPHGVYGNMYQHGYGYPPYGTYPSPVSPVPTLGHDGQLYGSQHYQYPTYYSSPSPQNAPYTPKPATTTSQGVHSTSIAAEQLPISVDTTKAKSNGTANGNAEPAKSDQHNSLLSTSSLHGRNDLSGDNLSSRNKDPIYNFDGAQSLVQRSGESVVTEGHHRQGNKGFVSPTMSRNQNFHLPHHTGLHSARTTPAAPGITNMIYPDNRMYSQCGNAFRSGLGVGSHFYDSRPNGFWGVAADGKYRPRARGNGFYGYGNENLDGLSELNRGPRAGNFKNQKGFGSTVNVAAKGENLSTTGNIEDSSFAPDKEQFNRVDFSEKYSDAKFYVIKSYSEDDVHKSIKYNVWASTPNGNKKLNTAYQEAQEKPGGCPVFLFFSVNTSGQFVGVAEMVGPVDFNKTVEYWQQDKWTGCFPLKWHIIKDVPNNILKHITLENNENKPVTNSRDTQEVKLEQGLQMLSLFKEHVSKTSVLDDFAFYETRQTVMLERRAKRQQLQKQMVEGKPINVVDEKDKDRETGKSGSQKSRDFVTVLKKEPVQVALSERIPSDENVVPPVSGDAAKLAKPISEKPILVNGIADGC